MIFLFKDSQNFILYESAEDRNLRAIFNRVKQHYLAIFLPTRMLYLHAKDELVSLDRLSSRGLWKWSNSRGFGPATIWRGAAFHFLAVFSKMKILWKLWLWFSKMFHQRVFLWLKMKYFEISVLTVNSRYLQTAALKREFSWL